VTLHIKMLLGHFTKWSNSHTVHWCGSDVTDVSRRKMCWRKTSSDFVVVGPVVLWFVNQDSHDFADSNVGQSQQHGLACTNTSMVWWHLCGLASEGKADNASDSGNGVKSPLTVKRLPWCVRWHCLISSPRNCLCWHCYQWSVQLSSLACCRQYLCQE